MVEIRIPKYSIYQVADDRLREMEQDRTIHDYIIAKDDDEYPTIAEREGQIIIMPNSESEDFFDILVSDRNNRPPLLLGSIRKKDLSRNYDGQVVIILG